MSQPNPGRNGCEYPGMSSSHARAALHAHVAFAARIFDLTLMFKQATANIEAEEGGTAYVLRRWGWLVAHSSGMAEVGEDWLGLGLVDEAGRPFTPDDAPAWAWPQVQAARIITAYANDDEATAQAVAEMAGADRRSADVLSAMADIVTAPVKPRIVPDDEG